MGNKEPALTTDGRRHFSLFKQVDRLVGASEAVPDLAYLHRILALCSLPRTNPGNELQYRRVNGPFGLYMVAGANNKLPYGNIPRLLMVWMCSEATQRQSPELFLAARRTWQWQPSIEDRVIQHFQDDSADECRTGL